MEIRMGGVHILLRFTTACVKNQNWRVIGEPIKHGGNDRTFFKERHTATNFILIIIIVTFDRHGCTGLGTWVLVEIYVHD